MVGGFAFTAAGEIIMCTDKGVYRLSSFSPQPKRLFDVPMAGDERFNDIAVDPQGRIFAGTITRYEYDLPTGDIEAPHVIYRTLPGNGVPDGITIDMAGHLWVACWGGGKVVRIDGDGRIVQEVPVPAVQPSSVIGRRRCWMAPLRRQGGAPNRRGEQQHTRCEQQ